MRALNSADLKVRGALWNDSVSASDAGAGVADVDAAAEPAAPEERDLNAAIVVESVVVVVVGAQELAKCQRRAIANAGVGTRDPRKGRPSGRDSPQPPAHHASASTRRTARLSRALQSERACCYFLSVTRALAASGAVRDHLGCPEPVAPNAFLTLCLPALALDTASFATTIPAAHLYTMRLPFLHRSNPSPEEKPSNAVIAVAEGHESIRLHVHNRTRTDFLAHSVFGALHTAATTQRAVSSSLPASPDPNSGGFSVRSTPLRSCVGWAGAGATREDPAANSRCHRGVYCQPDAQSAQHARIHSYTFGTRTHTARRGKQRLEASQLNLDKWRAGEEGGGGVCVAIHRCSDQHGARSAAVSHRYGRMDGDATGRGFDLLAVCAGHARELCTLRMAHLGMPGLGRFDSVPALARGPVPRRPSCAQGQSGIAGALCLPRRDRPKDRTLRHPYPGVFVPVDLAARNGAHVGQAGEQHGWLPRCRLYLHQQEFRSLVSGNGHSEAGRCERQDRLGLEDWYNIGSLSAIPTKLGLISALLAQTGSNTDVLGLNFTNGSSFPMALPPWVAKGSGYQSAQSAGWMSTRGVNALLVDLVAAKLANPQGKRAGLMNIFALDFFDQPGLNADLATLIVQANFI
ncbi:hypothetical protein L1887_51889 [Cichorium endivia]|nr:hypothetical protein L1887_51889 [Cichorium endivia]